MPNEFFKLQIFVVEAVTKCGGGSGKSFLEEEATIFEAKLEGSPLPLMYRRTMFFKNTKKSAEWVLLIVHA